MPRLTNLSDEAVKLIAARFRVLGEPIRIRMLRALQDGEKSVSELVAIVGSAQPNVSKHLRVLEEHGFIGRRQVGNTVYCSIADPAVFDLCNAVCDSLKLRFADHARIAAEFKGGRRR